MMIQMRVLCVGIAAEIVNAMYQSMLRSKTMLAPFKTATWENIYNGELPDCNLIFINLTYPDEVHHLQRLKKRGSGIAVVAFLEEGNKSLLDNIHLHGLDGICYFEDIALDRLFAVARFALHVKRQYIKSDIYFYLSRYLADFSRSHQAAVDILQLMCRIFNWQGGEIWARDESNAELSFVTSFSTNGHYTSFLHIYHPEDGNHKKKLPKHLYNEKELCLFNELSSHFVDDYLQVLKKNNVTSCIVIPILFLKEFLGVMLFWSDKSIATDEEVNDILRDAGKQFGSFIKRKRLEGDLLYLVEHDPLTNLANRAGLERDTNQAILQANRDQHLSALLFIDIDFFKEFNDAHGHLAGDKALKRIADCLRASVRETDSIARLDGDEFVVLLAKIAELQHVELICKKILHALHHLKIQYNQHNHFSASIGVSIYPYHGNYFEMLLQHADVALYQAKYNGRNNFKIFTYDKEIIANNETYLLAMQKALSNNEFNLYYQPIVDVKTNQIVGAESLLRWPFAPLAIARPESFIAFAEEVGLIDKLGEWVLRRACLDGIRIAHSTANLFKLVINVSPKQISRTFVSMVQAILIETGLDPAMLTLELTESCLLDSGEYNLSLLSSLRSAGIKLSIDDFGIGYSTFAYLNKFSVDCIKIDQSFTQSMLHLASAKAIVSAVLAIASALNLEVIAEGVDNQSQLHFLRKHRCHFYQGYFFKEALPIEEMLLLIK